MDIFYYIKQFKNKKIDRIELNKSLNLLTDNEIKKNLKNMTEEEKELIRYFIDVYFSYKIQKKELFKKIYLFYNDFRESFEIDNTYSNFKKSFFFYLIEKNNDIHLDKIFLKLFNNHFINEKFLVVDIIKIFDGLSGDQERIKKWINIIFLSNYLFSIKEMDFSTITKYIKFLNEEDQMNVIKSIFSKFYYLKKINFSKDSGFFSKEKILSLLLDKKDINVNNYIFSNFYYYFDTFFIDNFILNESKEISDLNLFVVALKHSSLSLEKTLSICSDSQILNNHLLINYLHNNKNIDYEKRKIVHDYLIEKDLFSFQNFLEIKRKKSLPDAKIIDIGIKQGYFMFIYLKGEKSLDLVALERDYSWLINYFSDLEEYTDEQKKFLNKFILHDKFNITHNEVLKKINIMNKMDFDRKDINRQLKKLT